MKILLMTQLFVPEMGALPNRMYPFARELAATGHTVFVATGMPNYPKGVVFDEYKGKRLCREQVDGYTVLRTAYYTVPRNRSKWSQLLSYLSFIPAAFWSGLRAGKLDVVFVTSPPIFPVVAAITLAWLRGAKLVFDVRDLWPDEIVACGGARPGSFPVRIIQALERWAYRRADRVCCTTRCFLTTVAERGVTAGKGVYLPNGADLELFRPLPVDPSPPAQHDLRDRFVVMYSGVFGIKHGLHTLLEAAKLLEGERDIVFVLMGSGAREEELVKQVKTMHLRNVIFVGEHSVRKIPRMLAWADVCISSLLPEPYLEKILSVKIMEYLACGKPVVGAHVGESARVLTESGGGLVVPPSDAQAMAGAIRRLYRDPDLRDRMATQGRAYVEREYSRTAIARRLEAMLRELVGAAAEQLQPSPVGQASAAVQFVRAGPVKLAASTLVPSEQKRSARKAARARYLQILFRTIESAASRRGANAAGPSARP